MPALSDLSLRHPFPTIEIWSAKLVSFCNDSKPPVYAWVKTHVDSSRGFEFWNLMQACFNSFILPTYLKFIYLVHRAAHHHHPPFLSSCIICEAGASLDICSHVLRASWLRKNVMLDWSRKPSFTTPNKFLVVVISKLSGWDFHFTPEGIVSAHQYPLLIYHQNFGFEGQQS